MNVDASSFLQQVTAQEAKSYLKIAKGYTPSKVEEGKDLFVGKNATFKLEVHNGTILKVRDIVVLGRLEVALTNPNDYKNPGFVSARRYIVIGSVRLSSVRLTSEAQASCSYEDFCKGLREIMSIRSSSRSLSSKQSKEES